MARRMQGTARVRRILRNLPDAMHGEMESAMQRGGAAIAQAMRARAPLRTGKLAQGIAWKLFPRSLKLRIGLLSVGSGPGTGGKRGGAPLFYGRIQEFGRRAQVVKVRRTKPAGGIVAYLMKVSPLAPKRFITGRMPALRNALQSELRGVWSKALRRIGSGSPAND